MIKNKSGNYIGLICFFSLMALMIIMSMMLIFTAASSYSKIEENTDKVYCKDTALCYIANKVHSMDNKGVEIHNEGDISYLCLHDDSMMYKTIIYYYDGYVYEDLMKADKPFIQGKGEKIVRIDNVRFDVNDSDNLVISVVSDNHTYTSTVHVYTGITMEQ